MGLVSEIAKKSIRRLLAMAGYEIKATPRSHLFHVYDYADLRFILDGCKRPTILDVGANVGETIDKFAYIFPDARIVGVEANPALFAQLESKYRCTHEVSLLDCAVSDKEGEAEFFLNDNHGMSSLLPWRSDSDNACRAKGTVKVRCRTLDCIAAGLDIEDISILKLDIQGGELRAIRGASRLMAANKIKVVFSEVWFSDKDYQSQPDFCDIRRHLAGQGFLLYGLYNVTQHPWVPNRPINACDAIFVHGSIFPQLKPLTHVVLGSRKTLLNRHI
jgi:FkbM family methyltransferase